MTNEGEQDPAQEEAGRQGFLFAEAGLNSPLEELRVVFEKRCRTARNLGEEEKARLYETAYELSRKRLSIALGEDP
jgi:hypothetical protein